MDAQPRQLQKPQGPEMPASGGLDQNHDQGFGFTNVLALAAIPLFLILFCVLSYDDVERVFESYLLLFILNTLLLSALPLVVSYFGLRAYLASGHFSLLMLRNGSRSLGRGSVLAALTPYSDGGPNRIQESHEHRRRPLRGGQ
jgi:hypothetical protein